MPKYHYLFIWSFREGTKCSKYIGASFGITLNVVEIKVTSIHSKPRGHHTSI